MIEAEALQRHGVDYTNLTRALHYWKFAETLMGEHKPDGVDEKTFCAGVVAFMLAEEMPEKAGDDYADRNKSLALKKVNDRFPFLLSQNVTPQILEKVRADIDSLKSP